MFWRREKFSCIVSGFEEWIGQPKLSQCTKYAIMALFEAEFDISVLFHQINPSNDHRSHLPCTTVNTEKEVQRVVAAKCSILTQKVVT
jgi:hypothetical protein